MPGEADVSEKTEVVVHGANIPHITVFGKRYDLDFTQKFCDICGVTLGDDRWVNASFTGSETTKTKAWCPSHGANDSGLPIDEWIEREHNKFFRHQSRIRDFISRINRRNR